MLRLTRRRGAGTMRLVGLSSGVDDADRRQASPQSVSCPPKLVSTAASSTPSCLPPETPFPRSLTARSRTRRASPDSDTPNRVARLSRTTASVRIVTTHEFRIGSDSVSERDGREWHVPGHVRRIDHTVHRRPDRRASACSPGGLAHRSGSRRPRSLRDDRGNAEPDRGGVAACRCARHRARGGTRAGHRRNRHELHRHHDRADAHRTGTRC